MSNEAPGQLEVRRVHPHELHELRRRVLRSNNPDISVADPRDEGATSLHFAGFIGERLVVSSSWFACVAPMNPQLVTYELRYMATDFDIQRRGYASVVLEEAEQELRRLGAQQLWANGRDSALGFYLATGWRVVEGSEHLSPETQLAHHVIFKILAES